MEFGTLINVRIHTDRSMKPLTAKELVPKLNIPLLCIFSISKLQGCDYLYPFYSIKKSLNNS